jgi:colanic acid biosynthesis glycosyl transferase WcaI
MPSNYYIDIHSMRILLYGINFFPELTGIGKYTGEMAAWLVSHGHEVRVVTAPPYYPAWAVSSGYSSRTWSTEKVVGADVWRCPLWVPAKPGGASRLVHLASFAVSSLPVMLRQIFWRPDVVWVVEPALFCAPCAGLVARLSGAKAWLHIQDFEVDAAFGLGLLRGKRIRALVERCESWLMRRFDVVSTISGRMMDLLLAKGVPARQTFLAPNWVDISAISPKTDYMGANPYRVQLGLPADCVVALYSGNMGGKQGLEILAEVARQREFGRAKSDSSPLVFVFCGDGAGKAALQSACAGLANVYFLPLQPLDRLNDLLALADIHLLPQRADAADLVMPSKLTGMLASGKPVVATAHVGTELARVVAGSGPDTQCGLVVPPEDATAMLVAIEVLVNDGVLRKRLGVAARAYAEQHLHIDMVLAKFANHMQLIQTSKA